MHYELKRARDHLVLRSFYRDISMASLHFSLQQFRQRHRITFTELIGRHVASYFAPIIPNKMCIKIFDCTNFEF